MKKLGVVQYMSLIMLAILGCGGFDDREVTTKDDAFRKMITRGSFIKLSQGYTYYEFENKDADTLLVMVHGFSVPSYIWDSTFFEAKKRGFGALRYDVYGRGYSDNPDLVYDGALFSGQLTELLEALGVTRKVDLIGLSYGGRIISAFAYQHPERVKRLIYVDAAGFETIPPDSLYPAPVTETDVADFKKTDNYRNMAKGQMADFYDPIPFAGWDNRYEEVMTFKGFARALLSTRRNSPSMEQEHRKITSLNLPVYGIWGEHDTVVPLKNINANIYDRMPYIALFILPKSGHLPHMEQTRMFNSILFDQILCCQPQQPNF